jgi:glycosyltransferase involved in cell wall biosynthesis
MSRAPAAHGDPLKVGIDGRAFSSPAAGVRRYVAGLTAGLLSLGEHLSVVALGGARDSIPAGVDYQTESLHPPTNLGWMLVGLPRAAARAGVDIIHAPAYTAPFWSPVPVVLTIHDVSYQRHPEWFPYRRDRFRRAFYRRSAHSAVSILTDSAFSASEITAAYGIPASRMAVVPLAVDPSFAAAHPGAAHDLPADVQMPFLLHVGDLHERRNLGTVVDALLAARQRNLVAGPLSLVLAGVDRGVGDALLARAAQAGAGDLIVRLGSIGEHQLHALYRAATALVYPSLYEGFGLPVLEAMASGTPVIASHAASIPEVLGDAGLLLDPRDVDAWTNAIVRVAGNEAERLRMSTAGRQRAAGFTWERTARATFDVYRRAIDGRQGK